MPTNENFYKNHTAHCETCGGDTEFYLNAADEIWYCTICMNELVPNTRAQRRHQKEHTWEPTYKKRK